MNATIGRSELRAGAVLVLALGALLAVTSPASAWTVSAAQLERTGDAAVLRLAGEGLTGPLPNDVFVLEDPWRVVVDLFGADAPLAVQGAETVALPGVVQGIRWSIWQSGPAGGTVRYVLDCRGPVQFRLEPSPGALAVRIDSPKETGAADPALSEAVSEVLAGPGPGNEGCTEAEAAPVTASPAQVGTGDPPQAGSEADHPDPKVAPATGSENDSALTGATAGLPVESPNPVIEAPAAAPSAAPVPSGPAAIAAPESQDAAPSLGSADAGVTAAAGDAGAMNLDVQGADIRSVIRSIAEYGGANIVADREVDGPVTVRLANVPWRQALDIVCQSAGMVTLESGGIIRVATLKTLRDEGLEKESSERKREDLQPLETHVFNVRYASAKELKDAVTFVLSKRGSANVDERTNTLLVSDIASRVAEVDKLVGTLDTETRQVEITARLVDVDRTAARQLGIQWSLDNLHSNSERVSGSVKVTEMPSASSGSVHLGVVRGFGNLDATIAALEQENKATLISSPRITTVNNRKAKILVGKEIPLIVLDIAGNSTTQLKKVGISLEVTPYINTDNRITMDLNPEVSDLSSQATVQGGIVFTNTSADTRVMVNDGETAVIGGLIRSSETNFAQGIPVLRSLPLIGGLFRSSDVRKENRELLIFVSPKVVEGTAEAR